MTEPELAAIDTAHHLGRLRAAVSDQGADGAIVTSLTNIRWLSGFTGSNAVLHLTTDAATLITDGRYAEQAPQQLAAAGLDVDVRVTPDALEVLTDLAATGRLAVEADDLSWAGHERWRAALGADLTPLATPMVELRARKDAGELDRIRHAAAIADAALADVVPMLADEPTEREIALELEVGMRRRGATSSAYETIVAAGPNAALPHARPTDRTIRAGDLVIIDVGALYDGYRSDMTRTFVVGEPTAEQERLLEVVREAQRLGVEVVRDGVAAVDIDRTCRGYITGAGLGPQFSHGTGHGVGLDIHELPAVNARATATVHDTMVVTVEPGVYLPGEGGVRWEDLLIVGSEGAEAVTHSPKQPVVSLS